MRPVKSPSKQVVTKNINIIDSIFNRSLDP